MNYKIKMPPAVYGGTDSVQILREILKKEHAKDVILFTDPGVKASGVVDSVVEIVKRQGTRFRIVDHLVPEPSAEDVQAILDEISEINCDLILAVGGGSTMDAAKLISILKGSKFCVRDLLNDSSSPQKRIKTIMIPTTCGTGSEATCNAIVAKPEEKLKVGIVSDEMIADYIILDPAMISGLPKKIVASSGIDALAHCVECYTSNKANPFSDVFALAGAKLIFKNIEKAYANPTDTVAKNNMLTGAFYGGVAITSSGTTAVHALSYPLGGTYHIAHGVSNAILFAPVMECNLPACADRLADLCDAIEPSFSNQTQQEKALHVVHRIREIVSFTEIPPSLKSFGVPKSDLDFLTDAASKVTRLLNNNRKKLTLEEIRSIYQQVL
ncbi:MAG: iron-containing alcohol dehydrogenase [Oscillospiraceae bacterium]|jgi:alcohol dehydrogenase class IV|nr:iron-containing alcohol dehydrogenase [Oscillospiraceae bacterium]